MGERSVDWPPGSLLWVTPPFPPSPYPDPAWLRSHHLASRSKTVISHVLCYLYMVNTVCVLFPSLLDQMQRVGHRLGRAHGRPRFLWELEVLRGPV